MYEILSIYAVPFLPLHFSTPVAYWVFLLLFVRFLSSGVACFFLDVCVFIVIASYFGPKRVSNEQIAQMTLTLCGSRSKRFSIRSKWNKFQSLYVSLVSLALSWFLLIWRVDTNKLIQTFVVCLLCFFVVGVCAFVVFAEMLSLGK